MADGTDIDFFLDPICPFAWLTSRWLLDVAPERDVEITWRFICLTIVNEGKDYGAEFPPNYPALHGLGRDLLRVAVAAREAGGNDAVGALYDAAGARLHVGGLNVAMFKGEPIPEGLIPELVADAGLASSLASAAGDEQLDDVLREETALALSRTGPDVGTPILTFDPGTEAESSFFGPVISRVPTGQAAVELYDAVRVLARTSTFAELKRSLREPLVLRPQA